MEHLFSWVHSFGSTLKAQGQTDSFIRLTNIWHWKFKVERRKLDSPRESWINIWLSRLERSLHFVLVSSNISRSFPALESALSESLARDHQSRLFNNQFHSSRWKLLNRTPARIIYPTLLRSAWKRKYSWKGFRAENEGLTFVARYPISYSSREFYVKPRRRIFHIRNSDSFSFQVENLLTQEWSVVLGEVIRRRRK